MKEVSRIVCAVDFSRPSLQALNHAIVFAKQLQRPLLLLHVIEPVPVVPDMGEWVVTAVPDVSPIEAEQEERAREQLRPLQARGEAEGVPTSIEILHGQAGATLVMHMSELHGSCMVLGTHGHRGLKRIMLGSTAAEVLRRAQCPVLAVQERHSARAIRHIGVGIDFSEAGRPAIDTAAWLARTFKATLHLVHVLPPIEDSFPPGMRVPLDAHGLLEASRAAADHGLQAIRDGIQGIEVVCRVLEGRAPYRTLARYAAEAPLDMLAVGTHGRSGLARFFLGSVAERVLRLSPCPVLGVTPPDELPIELDADDV